MALSLTGTSRLGTSTAAPTKTVVPQPTAASASATPNPLAYTPPTAYPSAGQVKGPYDSLRGQPPSGLPVSYWNAQLDQLNKSYQQMDPAQRLLVDNAIKAWGPKNFAQNTASSAQKTFAALPAAQRDSYQQQDTAAAPGGYGDPNSEDAKQKSLTSQIGALGAKDYDAQQNFYNTNVAPLYGQQANAAVAAGAADKEALAGVKAAGQKANTTLQGAFNEQRGIAGTANAQGTADFNNYKAGQDALNTQDQAGLADYLKSVDPLRAQITGIGSNPADVAAQQAALQRAIGIGGGSLNYNAAQASSDPADVARQQQGYSDLSGIGAGSLDYSSQAAQAFADPQDVAAQRKALADIQGDVAGGDKDQRDALDLIKSRTGVEPTAQERLLYELNRRQREAQDASSRAAVMNRQAARGLRSGGAELASMQQAGQQTAQDRLLADMAANAGAVQRAQSYTGMQAAQSNAMRTNQQTALGMQGNLSTALRNAGFDEAWKRGQGADTASANNQSTRLRGTEGSATVASAMRDASDLMSRFNTGETNTASANNQRTMLGGAELQVNSSNAIRTAGDTMNMHLDEQAQQDATRRAELEAKRASETRATTDQTGTRADTTYKAGVVNNDTNYDRNRQVIKDTLDSVDPTFNRDKGVAGAIADTGQRGYDRVTGMINTNIAGLGAIPTSKDLINVLKYGTSGSKEEEDEGAVGGA